VIVEVTAINHIFSNAMKVSCKESFIIAIATDNLGKYVTEILVCRFVFKKIMNTAQKELHFCHTFVILFSCACILLWDTQCYSDANGVAVRAPDQGTPEGRGQGSQSASADWFSQILRFVLGFVRPKISENPS